MRIVSLLGVGLFAFAVFIQLRTWRHQRRVRPGLIVVSQLAALASSVAFSALIHRPPSAESWVVLLGVGIFFGVMYGGLMVVDRTDRGVVMGYSLPAIVTWSALMVITQLATIFGRSVPVVIYSLAIVNLGVNLGMNGRVLTAYTTLRGAPAIGLLMVAGLSVMPTLTAGAQTGEPSRYAGTYQGSLMTEGAVQEQAPFTLEIDGAGSVAGSLDYETTFEDATVGTVYAQLTMRCDGVVDDVGNTVCSGTGSQVQTYYDGQGAHTASQDWTVSLTLLINPDGTFNGQGTDDTGATYSVTGFAVSGGPAGSTPPTVPGETTPTVPGETTPAVPPNHLTEEPLTDEEAATAVGLANLILAGGSLAQLLPLLQKGMSLQDALRLVTGPEGAMPDRVVDALAGFARTADGKVIFQPPWEVGGPIAMDPDQVRRVLDLQEQGYRWTGETGGWMTPDQEDMNRAWDVRRRAADATDRARFLADQAQARADLAAQREALDALKRARQIVDDSSRTGVQRYEMLSDQMYELAFTPDGGIDVDYVRRMRSGLGEMLRSDVAVSDESLQQTLVSDFASATWNDARHNAAIRIGTGVLSGGQSEWLYQSQGVLDAMDQASQQGDLTYTDGLRIAYGTIAEENLPVTTVRKIIAGEQVGILDVAGVLLKGVNVRAQAKGLIAEHVPDSAGLVGWQRRAIQAEASASDVDLLFRPVNPGASKAVDLPGKLPWMKQKTITADDVALLGYPKNQIGQVPGGPPRSPTGFTNAEEYRQAMGQYSKRAAEWAECGSTTREAIAAGKVVEVDGVLRTVNPSTGRPGAAFVADLDPADVVTAGGGRMSDAGAVRVMRNLEERGLAVGGHGSPYTWNPATASGEVMKRNLIADIEAGRTGDWYRPGGAAGARPRWTEGAVGAGLHDAGRP